MKKSAECKIDGMKKTHNPTWEHYRLMLYVLFLCELILFLSALIFGRVLGYTLTLAACFWFGVIVALCYLMIVCANLGVIFFQMLHAKIKNGIRNKAASNRNADN
jgi:hypothetical protein